MHPQARKTKTNKSANTITGAQHIISAGAVNAANKFSVLTTHNVNIVSIRTTLNANDLSAHFIERCCFPKNLSNRSAKKLVHFLSSTFRPSKKSRENFRLASD